MDVANFTTLLSGQKGAPFIIDKKVVAIDKRSSLLWLITGEKSFMTQAPVNISRDKGATIS
jgi:hypothetical protein